MAPGRVSAACWVLTRVHRLRYLQRKSWLTHSRVSLLVGNSAAFQYSSHKSPAAIWFGHPTHLSYERTGAWWACLPWISALACSVSNKLESWMVRLTVPALRGPGQAGGGEWADSPTVLQQESGDPSPLPAVPWWSGGFGESSDSLGYSFFVGKMRALN